MEKTVNSPEEPPQALMSRRRILVTTTLAGAAIYLAFSTFGARYTLALDEQRGPTCLPWDVYLVDRSDRSIVRGSLAAFRAGDHMAPFFAKHQLVIKKVAAVPGDHLEIEGNEAAHTYINGEDWGTTMKIAEHFPEKAPGAFAKDQIVPAGKVLMLGTLPNSYDGRYYGYINQADIEGRAYALF